MPWNDNVRPGPWGSPEGEDGDRDPADPKGGKEGSGKKPEESGPRSPWGDSGGPSGAPQGQRPTPGRPAGPRRLTPRPGAGPRRSPEFEQLSREWTERARRFFRNPNGRGVRPGAVAVLAGAAVGLWALSGV